MDGRRRGGAKAPTKKELQQQVLIMQAKLDMLYDGGASTGAKEPRHTSLCNQDTTAKAASNVVYTDHMIRTLLELRWSRFRAAFEKCTSHAQRSVLWEKLTLKFNILAGQKLL
ncbi:hypothetical protein AC1031_019281 [Aphanomyces cochlioides]|nr:hypothetical protein AC1031_019281 [Aphanomyces cochlioides]